MWLALRSERGGDLLHPHRANPVLLILLLKNGLSDGLLLCFVPCLAFTSRAYIWLGLFRRPFVLTSAAFEYLYSHPLFTFHVNVTIPNR